MNDSFRHHLAWWLLFQLIKSPILMNYSSTSFSLKSRLQSFKHAFNGFKILLIEEHNARIHLFAALLVIILSFLFELNNTDWLFVIFAITLAISAEMVNTIVENICDFISHEKHPDIKKIKDLSAAFVLFTVFTSIVVAAIVFIPKL